MIKKWFLLFILVLVALPAYAVKLTDLYQVELPVHSQLAAERSKAVQAGFKQVLVKLTGNAQILDSNEIKPYLSKSEDFVEEYAYGRPQHSKANDQFVVKIRYSKEEIDQMLASSKIASWGENRPLTLVWLTVAGPDGKAEIIGNDKPAQLLDKMKTFSERYGLPLIFPVMDMSDMGKVTPENVINMDLAHLKVASMRYSPDVLLLGSMNFKDGEYYSEWRLIANSTQWSWGLKAATTEQTITQVFAQVEETLAKHYVVAADAESDQKVKLQVSNITKSEDLMQLVKHLKELKSLGDIELLQISGSQVELSASLRGSVETLQQNTSLNRRMVLKSQDGEDKLYYEWIK